MNLKKFKKIINTYYYNGNGNKLILQYPVTEYVERAEIDVLKKYSEAYSKKDGLNISITYRSNPSLILSYNL